MATINEKRSIVVVGVTGCGKSTVCNKILGEEWFQIDDGFKACTAHVASKERRVNILGETIDVTVIDTVGLADGHSDSSSVDPMKELRQKIKEIGGINLVLFVIRRHRLTTSEKEAIQLIHKNLKDTMSQYSAIIITGCEAYDPDGRQRIIDELKNDTITGSFASSVQMGVITVGFPNLTTFMPQVRNIYQGIAEDDAKELHKLVHKAVVHYSYSEIFVVGCFEILMQTWEAIKAMFRR